MVAPGRMSLVGARDKEELQLISPLPEVSASAGSSSATISRHADLNRSRRLARGRTTDGGSGFWLHLDVDVLDREAFPATDYLMPDGLSMDELRALFAPWLPLPA